MNEAEDIVIMQLKKGDKKGYHYLFEHYYAPLCRLANFYVSDSFAAENIVEDFLFFLWKQRESIDIKASLRGYLFTSIRNRSLNYLKRNNVIHETNFSSFSNDMADVPFHQDESTGLVSMIAQELDEKIRDCVAKLPNECRTVFEMSRYENMKYKEISAKIGTSVNTVQYHMKNALASLRKELDEYLF